MIGFIGAGQVGTTLGIYFANMGIPVSGYYSNSLESAKKSASRTKSEAYEFVEKLINTSTYIMITTSDDAIRDVVKKLIMNNLEWDNKVICHTSGVHPSTLLEPLFHCGATTASLHPMLSFADIDYALKVLRQTPLTLEGKGPLMNNLKEMLQSVHLKVHEIETEQKALYHASACMVSNYLVTLMDIGTQSLVRAGFNQEAASELIAPLAKGTLHNIFEKGPERALTGPIARGDVNTIRTHIQAISQEDKKLEEFYCLLGERTLDITKRQNKLDEYTLNRLKEVLQNEKSNDRNH